MAAQSLKIKRVFRCPQERGESICDLDDHHGDKMSALSPASKRALSNLRAFVPPKTNYYQCPLKRRAAVLILLFADRVGDLRVVLTIRSAGLKNCEFCFVLFSVICSFMDDLCYAGKVNTTALHISKQPNVLRLASILV